MTISSYRVVSLFYYTSSDMLSLAVMVSGEHWSGESYVVRWAAALDQPTSSVDQSHGGRRRRSGRRPACALPASARGVLSAAVQGHAQVTSSSTLDGRRVPVVARDGVVVVGRRNSASARPQAAAAEWHRRWLLDAAQVFRRDVWRRCGRLVDNAVRNSAATAVDVDDVWRQNRKTFDLRNFSGVVCILCIAGRTVQQDVVFSTLNISNSLTVYAWGSKMTQIKMSI